MEVAVHHVVVGVEKVVAAAVGGPQQSVLRVVLGRRRRRSSGPEGDGVRANDADPFFVCRPCSDDLESVRLPARKCRVQIDAHAKVVPGALTAAAAVRLGQGPLLACHRASTSMQVLTW